MNDERIQRRRTAPSKDSRVVNGCRKPLSIKSSDGKKRPDISHQPFPIRPSCSHRLQPCLERLSRCLQSPFWLHITAIRCGRDISQQTTAAAPLDSLWRGSVTCILAVCHGRDDGNMYLEQVDRERELPACSDARRSAFSDQLGPTLFSKVVLQILRQSYRRVYSVRYSTSKMGLGPFSVPSLSVRHMAFCVLQRASCSKLQA